MKKINCKDFKMYTDISQQNTVVADIRRDFADVLYQNANGIVAHDLALRIYRSEDVLELTDEEFNICREIAQMGKPIFYDSFLNNVTDETNS